MLAFGGQEVFNISTTTGSFIREIIANSNLISLRFLFFPLIYFLLVAFLLYLILTTIVLIVGTGAVQIMKLPERFWPRVAICLWLCLFSIAFCYDLTYYPLVSFTRPVEILPELLRKSLFWGSAGLFLAIAFCWRNYTPKAFLLLAVILLVTLTSIVKSIHTRSSHEKKQISNSIEYFIQEPFFLNWGDHQYRSGEWMTSLDKGFPDFLKSSSLPNRLKNLSSLEKMIQERIFPRKTNPSDSLNTIKDPSTKFLIKSLKKPNIIIIGLDAVRFDHLSLSGYKLVSTPRIDNFLKNSIFFNNTLTPLARTYPAWTSILTGDYPIHNGIRLELQESNKKYFAKSLPIILHRQGYQSWFAIDDWNFCMLKKDAGFDKLINQKIQPLTLLISLLAKTVLTLPLANNHLIAPIFFPQIYGDRGVADLYDPDSFLAILKKELKQRKKNKPIFLGIHLTLAHYPYFWRLQSLKSKNKDRTSNLERYDRAIATLDIQFQNLLSLLKKEDLLRNTILIVISDHGEALNQPNDRLLNWSNYLGKEKNLLKIYREFSAVPPIWTKNHADQIDPIKRRYDISRSIGHGTDIISPSQYRAILSWQFFDNAGKRILSPHIIEDRTVLIDIRPTILQIMNIKADQCDGISLLPAITQRRRLDDQRPILLETGYTPSALRREIIVPQDIIKEAVPNYHLNIKTGEINLKKTAIPSLIKNKRYAILYHNYLLTIYPESKFLLFRAY